MATIPLECATRTSTAFGSMIVATDGVVIRKTWTFVDTTSAKPRRPRQTVKRIRRQGTCSEVSSSCINQWSPIARLLYMLLRVVQIYETRNPFVAHNASMLFAWRSLGTICCLEYFCFLLVHNPVLDGQTVDVEEGTNLGDGHQSPSRVSDQGEHEVSSKIP
jgi:hypothetical protein